VRVRAAQLAGSSAPATPMTSPASARSTGRDLQADAVHDGHGVTVVSFGDFVESYQRIHARHGRFARPGPASAVGSNLPAAAADFRLPGRP